jgi:hypothetical protein
MQNRYSADLDAELKKKEGFLNCIVACFIS